MHPHEHVYISLCCAGMANRTTLVDNNTWNNSHIALVGKAMSSTEDKAYKIMRMLGVDYVLVIFGGMIGYSGDDINKFLWMVRIAEGEHPQDIKVPLYVHLPPLALKAGHLRLSRGFFLGWEHSPPPPLELTLLSAVHVIYVHVLMVCASSCGLVGWTTCLLGCLA